MGRAAMLAMRSGTVPDTRGAALVPKASGILCAVLVAIAATTLPGSSAAEDVADLRAQIAQGRYAEAEADARALLATVETAKGPDSVEAAEVLDWLVESLWRGGKAAAPETMELAERALRTKERVLGPEHADLARSVNALAVLHLLRHELDESKPLFRRALAIREKTLGPDHPDVAKTLGNYASVFKQQNDFDAARPLYERALAIQQKSLGEESVEAAMSLNALAFLSREEGDYEAARPLFERARAILDKTLGPEHPTLAFNLTDYGNMLVMTGDYAGARVLLERALAIWEKALGPEHPNVSAALHNLAQTLWWMGDYQAAMPLVERALAIDEKLFGSGHPVTAANLDLEANLLEKTGDLAGARTLFEKALAIREKALGPDHPEVAISLHNLAATLLSARERAKAKPLYERALVIREKALGPGHPDVAKTLIDLAKVLRDEGDRVRSRDALTRAVSVQESALGPEHPLLALTLSELALLDLETGRTDEALKESLRAEEIGRNHLRLTARALPERQALRYAAARYSGQGLALSLAAQDGVSAAERIRSSNASAVRGAWDSLVRSRALVLDEIACRHRVLGLATDRETARLASDLSAARGRLANLIVRGPGSSSPEEYRKLLDTIRGKAERVERTLAGKSTVVASQRAMARAGLDDVVARLPEDSALMAFARYEHVSPTHPGTGSNGASEPRYLAFVVTRGTAPTVVPLGMAAAIDSAIERWRDALIPAKAGDRAALERSEAALRTAGDELRRAIWDGPWAKASARGTTLPSPAQASLGRRRSIRRVFVVPDGGIHLVNFAALPEGGGSGPAGRAPTRYLVESGPEFHTLSAERDLILDEDRPHRGHGLLAMGGAAYDAATGAGSAAGDARSLQVGVELARREKTSYRGGRSLCRGFQDLRFVPLPGTVKEVEAVGDVWARTAKSTAGSAGSSGTTGTTGPPSPAIILTSGAATEAAFKTKAPGRRVLHLATHGFFLGGSCPSALEGTRGVGGLALQDEEPAPANPGENPLLLSGLALVGANQRQAAGLADEDGILTAEEIAATDLSGVEWAVLSACSTGIGQVQAGEGVLGLRRAFRIAGARSVIMSLSPVDDEATREWMQALYAARFTDRMGTAAAVRKASLESLRKRKEKKLSTHPFYWAAFVASGDWR